MIPPKCHLDSPEKRPLLAVYMHITEKLHRALTSLYCNEKKWLSLFTVNVTVIKRFVLYIAVISMRLFHICRMFLTGFVRFTHIGPEKWALKRHGHWTQQLLHKHLSEFPFQIQNLWEESIKITCATWFTKVCGLCISQFTGILHRYFVHFLNTGDDS